jgi:hypothetical protein
MSSGTQRIRGLSPILVLVATAAAAAPGARIESGVVLMPGETLVAPPGPTATPRPAPRAAPKPPQYTASEVRRDRHAPPSRSICINCAVVTAIDRGPSHWEVGLRFDDGTRETHRFYDHPPVRVGDAVHVEQGRLVRD